MQILLLRSGEISITVDTTILDRGEIHTSKIHIHPGVSLNYVFIGQVDAIYTRDFYLEQDTSFEGGVVVYGHNISLRATTHIKGNNVSSHLQILGLARLNSQLDIQGSSIVSGPYRHVITRVDQNNLFLGEGGNIRGMPILQVATDDIEGGHSCRIYRISGEALFYLQSHGLDSTTAEGLLIEAELRKHTSVISDCDICDSLVEEVQKVIFDNSK